MEFEWDEAKSLTNQIKHSLSFASIKDLRWDRASIELDLRRDYEEIRFVARMMDQEGLGYTVVFTTRGPKLRIISFRRWNRREYLVYGT